jgi:hypothetical protein
MLASFRSLYDKPMKYKVRMGGRKAGLIGWVVVLFIIAVTIKVVLMHAALNGAL